MAGHRRSGHWIDTFRRRCGFLLFGLVETYLFCSDRFALYNIVSWFRFRDDILIISDTCCRMTRLLNDLTCVCNTWKLTSAAEDTDVAPLHDLDVQISNSTGSWSIA